LLQIS